jgi:hypothetical protein
MFFDWDDEKARTNLVKHGVSFVEAQTVSEKATMSQPNTSCMPGVRIGEDPGAAMSKAAKKVGSKPDAFSRVYRGKPAPHLVPQKDNIFLSYHSADRPLAKQVAEKLAAAGYRISNGEDVVEPGANWLAAVGRALDRSNAIVFFLSRAALRSESTTLELGFVLGSKKFKDRVVPVLVDTDPSDVPWIVRHLPFVSTGKSADADAGRIAQAVARELDQRV